MIVFIARLSKWDNHEFRHQIRHLAVAYILPHQFFGRIPRLMDVLSFPMAS